MADLGGDDVALTTITQLLGRPNVVRRVDALRREIGVLHDVRTEEGTAFAEEFSPSFLMSTIFISINGTGDLPEQKVQVQYLAQSQQLRIPQGLGIYVPDPRQSEAANSERIVGLYWAVGSKTLQELFDFVEGPETVAVKRAAANAWTAPSPRPPMPLWLTQDYYNLSNGRGQDEAFVSVIFATVCRLLRLNYDIRDTGALVGTVVDMRLPDGAWSDPNLPGKTRLTSKLQPYTMACLAGLNMQPCSNFPVGAWIRSFGVSAGILPDRQTRVNKEWVYTSAGITDEEQRAADGVHNSYGAKLQALCMNAIALFGLLHLNKNHTFVTGDASMERVGQAFINTLRVMITPEQIEDLKSRQEVFVRTAVHPFGLGQTYATALIMGQADTLVSPLKLRLTVSPPLTQRLMIVHSAVKEWGQLPVGPTMMQIFHTQITTIEAAILQVKANPPAHSELWAYYGEQALIPVSERAKVAADSMMPCVYGYAQAFHTAGETSRDGIALAMSFENVLRDQRASSLMFVSMWTRYHDTMESGGLEAFIETALRMVGVAPAT